MLRTSTLLTAALLATPVHLTVAQRPTCAAKVDAGATALDSALITAMGEYDVPGAALAIVRDGAVDRLRGYGCANIARDVPVDPRSTVFRVASVSKPFVATAALIAAERGVVDLRTDVNRYLRTFQVPAAWDRPITLHDLLTHSAGLEESVVGYAARTPADVRPLGEFLAAKLPRRGWAPGTVTAYSNYGYALAGYVVEAASGTSFADYARNEVFTPLRMTRSSFAQPMPAELQRDLATSYRCAESACEPVPTDYRSAYPPGGLVTTAEDMSRFLLAQLGVALGTRRVLGDSLLAHLRTRQFTNDPSLPGLTYAFAEETLAGERAFSHAGGASGYTSFIVVVPERRWAAFIVANGGSSRFGAAALSAITRLTLPGHATTPADSQPSVTASVDPTGAYRLTRYAHRGVENLPALFNGQLHVSRHAGDTIAIQGLGDANGLYVPVAANRWKRVNGPDLVAARALDGAVTHFFGSQSFFGTRFPSAYERLAWYDEPGFMNEALSFVLAIPLFALLAWPLTAGATWLIRRKRAPTHGRATRATRGRALAVIAGVVSLALTTWFGFGFIAASNRAAERGGGEIIYGLPPAMQILAYVPGILGVLAVALVVASVLGWRRRWWSIPGRVIYSIIAVGAVLFVAILVRWGYFPVATG